MSTLVSAALDARLPQACGAGPNALNGPLPVGVDQRNVVSLYHRGDSKPDGKRALAAAAFLGGQDDRTHVDRAHHACLSPANSTPNAKI